MDYLLSEYGLEDLPECLEELEEEIERDKSEDELTVVTGAGMTAEKKIKCRREAAR